MNTITEKILCNYSNEVEIAKLSKIPKAIENYSEFQDIRFI